MRGYFIFLMKKNPAFAAFPHLCKIASVYFYAL